ncbi:two component transcriptional regulator, LuxR family [Streptoalloteichus tenebrarius]|uniref:Two component transcriptional regulator, LuxR family n=1 Tax=Streptoalloteichus tenebrarius (strain ATCC 17920 / DSM 40477 / JCM 4838 / CBS 697.72 / NBRC 16177 / NCIMB 11028 / NRRL B-12390 / A12253. 1 / ISP 5477) TaxID=1933 RepID=A0ABT1HN39_STRSD|nr:response regulator transcription factor [Streptoalloteichus tenebrarius]MCP2256932.1 two component transcriptional regulator, LuxR family [Streptoalloteichus tenebrarius]BFF00157.1 response regulator transcription factor [Streptoalloteichus tenebrarius]
MRILIGEDSAVLREGMVHLLRRFGHEVVAAVRDAPSLVAAATEHAPDLSVIDVRMPPGFTDEGLRAALEIRERDPDAKIMVFSQHVNHRYATELLGAGTGGTGYLLKDRVGDVEEFVTALEQVANGRSVIDPEVVRQLLARRRRSSPIASLTPRERSVLALMAEGKTNSAIARCLSVSDATVAKHVNSIFAKLDLSRGEDEHRRVHAVLTYLQSPP